MSLYTKLIDVSWHQAPTAVYNDCQKRIFRCSSWFRQTLYHVCQYVSACVLHVMCLCCGAHGEECLSRTKPGIADKKGVWNHSTYKRVTHATQRTHAWHTEHSSNTMNTTIYWDNIRRRSRKRGPELSTAFCCPRKSRTGAAALSYLLLQNRSTVSDNSNSR